MDGDEEDAAGMAHPLLLLPPNSSSPSLSPSEQQQEQGERNDDALDAQEDTGTAAGRAIATASPAETAYLQASDDEMGSATSRALDGTRITAANASPAAAGPDTDENSPLTARESAAAATERGGNAKRRAQDDDHADDSPLHLAGGGALSSQESMPSPSKKARRGGQELARTLSGLGQAAPDYPMLDGSVESDAADSERRPSLLSRVVGRQPYSV